MRAMLFALAMLPVAAHAQETTLPTPTEPVAQSCPVGMTFNAATQSCGLTPHKLRRQRPATVLAAASLPQGK